MSYELKIKAATLTAEAAIIRRIERKLKKMRSSISHQRTLPGSGDAQPITIKTAVAGTNPEGYTLWGNAKLRSLQAHRRGPVRHEARKTHLARMFLKGTPYKKAEAKVHDNNRLSGGDWNAIQKMAERYARYAKMSADSARGEWRSVQQLAQAFEEWKQAT